MNTSKIEPIVYDEYPSGSYHGHDVTVDPVALCVRFPDYSSSDEYKSTKEWSFTFDGHYFRVYDWKETSEYDTGLPSPLKFWNQRTVTLHIGHFRNVPLEIVDAFRNELLRTLRATVASETSMSEAKG